MGKLLPVRQITGNNAYSHMFAYRENPLSSGTLIDIFFGFIRWISSYTSLALSNLSETYAYVKQAKTFLNSPIL